MNLGICVGNGLSIDLQKKYASELSEFNTYKFFSWNVNEPNSDVLFLDKLPKLKAALSEINGIDNDFKVMELLLEKVKSDKDNFENSLLLCEMQHYIAIAFSKYQYAIDEINIEEWKWVEWLKKVQNILCFAISFNYDLVFERALHRAGIHYRRIGARNENIGIHILKPHGSIDFEMAPNFISCPPITYPLSHAIHSNDCGIMSLKPDKYLSPRLEVDIVLPNEYSSQLHYQWIKPGYDAIKNQGNIFTHFAFIGLSSCKFDEEEINTILNSLNKTTKIIIINPCPDENFVKYLESKFIKVEVWKDELKELY